MKYDQAVIRLSCKKDIDLFVQIHWLHSAFGFGFEVACFFDFVLFRVWFLKFLSCILNKFTLGLLYICAGAT